MFYVIELNKINEEKNHEGGLIIFDGFSPHRTFLENQINSGVRVSIDFRMRKENPYVLSGKVIDKAVFNNYEPGNPGLGYYWTTNKEGKKGFETLTDKIEFELSVASDNGDNATLMRKEYINKNIKNNKLNITG